MIYAVLEGDSIREIRAGDPSRRGIDNFVVLPADHQVRPGTQRTCYNDRWQLRPIPELLADGLLQAPEGMIWDEQIGNWRSATEAELVADGRRELQEREVLDGDYVRPLTPNELVQRNVATTQEREAIERQTATRRLQQLDQASTRPLRAIAAGVATEQDRAKLQEIETEAQQLRERLRQPLPGRAQKTAKAPTAKTTRRKTRTSKLRSPQKDTAS